VERGSVSNNILLFKEVPFLIYVAEPDLTNPVLCCGAESYEPGSNVILCTNVNLNPDPVLYTDLYTVLINLV
jgi:hypothetical protein